MTDRILFLLWILTIVIDAAGGVVGSRAAWAWRTKDGKRRPEVAIAWAFFLGLYGFASASHTLNSVMSIGEVSFSKLYIWWAVTNRLIQGVGVWLVALTLVTGPQGFIRRRITQFLLRFQEVHEYEQK